LWHHYYSNSDAVIYVLDTADPERFETAKETLHCVINSDDLKNCPILILANKIDISGMSAVKIV